MRTLKIKLDKATHLKEYEAELNRWESEGGKNSSDLNEILNDIRSPLMSGQIFEVIGGAITSDEEGYYYEIKIDLLSMS